MKNIIKTFSLLSLMAVIPGAMAATSRVSMISKVSPRLPSIAAYIAQNSANKTTVVTGTTSTTYMADIDCLDNYSECIRGADACGADFSECPTNIALHTKMPVCLSVLSQCSATGVQSLFGTSNLATITTPITNAAGEITGYTYPSADSALGQMVTASSLTNRLTKDQCVKKYTTCLHKDSVCGDDFELCTDPKEFKKQALSCDSVLVRCQSDGKAELFGSTANADSLTPANGSRLAGMISDGAQLAAVNTVSTCYKVADQCIMSACSKNPTKCLEGRNKKQVKIADNIADGTATAVDTEQATVDLTTASDVHKFIKGACLDTIGTNKYCYATVTAGEGTSKYSKMKFNTAKESYAHLDEDEIDEVFEDLYAARMRESLKKSIEDMAEKFDKKAKDSCIDTISSCAMRSCGGGIGSVCYTQSRTTDSVDIRTAKSYKEIQSACGAIVNTDSNCQYAASAEDSVFAYNYIDNSIFSTLVPEDAASDPIGVVASLNALLATSYNDLAIENMRKQCQTVALSCVRSMCGKEYENCYRNRTDIVSGTYDTGMAKFDSSMNKVGGVIDYNIVIGLCMNTVQNNSVCNEHLKIALNNEMTNDKIKSAWGNNQTVRNAWQDANTTLASEAVGVDEVVVGCTVSKTSTDCPAGIQMDDEDGFCIGITDENGCIYDTPVTQKIADYQLSNAATTLFQQLLVDVEKEAQAKYNAKLTKEQNICLSNNNGGIKGAVDNGSTFMWVKLKSNKIPKNYNMRGLTTKQFVASNDLYGSFCRARITVTSDDRAIQEALGDRATAYFAVGDSFTCGSWIDNATLNKITNEVAKKARKDAGEGSTQEKIAYAWGTVAPFLAGGAIGTALTESGLVGGWMNSANQKNSNDSTQKQRKSACISFANRAISLAVDETKSEAESALNSAKKMCENVVAGDLKQDFCAISTISTQTIKSSAESIKDACASAADTKTGYDDDDNKKLATRIAVPLATAVAGGALGAGITASVLQAKYEDAANEAVAAWLEEVGEHIQCYLGGDELGSYGDVISIEVE